MAVASKRSSSLPAARSTGGVWLGLAALLVALLAPAGPARASVLPGPQPHDLGSLADPEEGFAAGLNDAGVVVGQAGRGDGKLTAARWPAAGGPSDLTPQVPDDSIALDVNSQGVVLGNYASSTPFNSGRIGFTWTSTDGLNLLKTTPDDHYSDALALNENGQIAGTLSHAWMQEGHYVAAYWPSPTSTPELIPRLPGGTSNGAGDINDSGHIVGSSETQDGDPNTIHGFVWNPTDGLVDIGTLPGGTISNALHINNSDVVVGDATDANGDYHVVRWTAETGLQDLGLGSPYAINNAGMIAGQVPSGNTNVTRVWRPDGTTTDLDGFEGGSIPAALSEDGTVVGYGLDASGHQFAFAWNDQIGLRKLPALGGPDAVGSAYDVNAAGLVVGVSTTSDGNRPTSWDLSNLPTSQPPAAPRAPVAAAGDAKASLSWQPPDDDGGAALSGYTARGYDSGGTLVWQGQFPASTTSAVATGLSNGAPYTFDVTASNAVGDGDPSPRSAPITPRAGAADPASASGISSPGSGGTVSTGTNPDASKPLATTVQVPQGTSGGALAIAQTAVDVTAPPGWSFLGQQVNISAPVASVTNPLVLSFVVDASLAPGQTPASLQVYRTEGAGLPSLVRDCTGAPNARPNPCVSSRSLVNSTDLKLVVLTTSASAWDFAVRSFPFKGFFAPVANPPTINKVKEGSTVPLKFSLGGNRGSSIFLSGYPRVIAVDCAHPSSSGTTTSPAAGKLTYQARSDTYTYEWHVPNVPKGTNGHCRRVEVGLKDLTTHNAYFQLNKK